MFGESWLSITLDIRTFGSTDIEPFPFTGPSPHQTTLSRRKALVYLTITIVVDKITASFRLNDWELRLAKQTGAPGLTAPYPKDLTLKHRDRAHGVHLFKAFVHRSIAVVVNQVTTQFDDSPTQRGPFLFIRVSITIVVDSISQQLFHRVSRLPIADTPQAIPCAHHFTGSLASSHPHHT
jgi:hypothetical protein